MPVISDLRPEQEALIPLYVEKWRDTCVLTTPVDGPEFEEGLCNVLDELGMETPNEFFYFLSPAAMWRGFNLWKDQVTRVLTQYWSYQVPLCDPDSMHRLWRPGSERAAFNFAATRYSPGPKWALCEDKRSDETSGNVLDRTFHAELWKRFHFEVPFDWSLVAYDPCGGYAPPTDFLEGRAYIEDPANQMRAEDYCFVSPSAWLLRELACVEFCHRVLGVPRNERLYSGLEAIVQNGSFFGLFGTLCVACQRPCRIEVEKSAVRLTFRDGAVFDFPDRSESA